MRQINSYPHARWTVADQFAKSVNPGTSVITGATAATVSVAPMWVGALPIDA